MTHLLHPEDDKFQDLAHVEHRRVDRDSHIERWLHASEYEQLAERANLEKSDMGQPRKKNG